ncbi:hypothetical protein E2C01_040129 [Portunus trituberculatus]|uniref:Uncharacterized protein n=1 Tax=Portunus trituberculatus TaxID=210409 RepID=A0A5B7FMG8_PORTR|nr:hypothetical protein [Portunus trituberculatus]
MTVYDKELHIHASMMIILKTTIYKVGDEILFAAPRDLKADNPDKPASHFLASTQQSLLFTCRAQADDHLLPPVT